MGEGVASATGSVSRGATPIVARGLVKRYGDLAAVDRVDLTVETGDVYGFLGPNGAGKTTTLRMLLGLVHPDAGSIRLFGRDPQSDLIPALHGVAGIIEEPRLYPYLSGRVNLELLAAFDRAGEGEAAIEEVLELVELRKRADDRVSEYSQGMRQRLGIAACLVKRPRLLLLDEPANGVDPAGIRFLRDLIRRLGKQGITILLSSHLLAEVEEVCSRVAVIAAGRIVHEGSLDELRASAAPSYRLQTTDFERACAVCAELNALRGLNVQGDELIFGVEDDEGLVALSRALADAGIGIRSLVREQASLEGLFFQLTEQPDAAEVRA